MFQYRVLCFLVILPLTAPVAAATDLASLEATIAAKNAEISDLRDQLQQQQQVAARLGQELTRLRENAQALEQRRTATLSALQEQFERLVADPSQTLAPAQQDYREAFDAMAAHSADVAAKEQQVSDSERRVAEIREVAARAGRDLAEARAGFDRARAERLFAELNVAGELTLSNTVSCKQDETIGACMARGQDAARQLARERFSEQILGAVSEADVVAEHRGSDGLTPTLIDSSVINSGFRGQGDFFVELSARLRNETTQEQACGLLGLSDEQCRGEVAAVATLEPPPASPEDLQPEAELQETLEAPEPPAESEAIVAGEPQFRLTVRSNVYYDEVFIDGVAYGSTKLDVLLPAGEYTLEVRKPGHRSYRERVNLSGNRTVTAQLAELAELAQ
jgi:hypothetical protein